MTLPPLVTQDESFQAFANRPEHKKVLEAHQRKEAKQALRLQEKMRSAEFQEKVMLATLLEVCAPCLVIFTESTGTAGARRLIRCSEARRPLPGG